MEVQVEEEVLKGDRLTYKELKQMEVQVEEEVLKGDRLTYKELKPVTAPSQHRTQRV